jgi:hypothetical protein
LLERRPCGLDRKALAMTDPIARLRAAVRQAGSPLAAVLGDEPGPAGDGGAEPARVAAAGPRTAADRDEVELAVAAIHEGYRLHYASSRAVPVDDPDLALLAGDRLYALGLSCLAELGDLVAIGELGDRRRRDRLGARRPHRRRQGARARRRSRRRRGAARRGAACAELVTSATTGRNVTPGRSDRGSPALRGR